MQDEHVTGPPDPDVVNRQISIVAEHQSSPGHLRGPRLRKGGGHRNGRGPRRIMEKPSWS